MPLSLSRRFKVFFVFGAGLFLTLGYQNCSGSFHSSSVTDTISNSAANSIEDNSQEAGTGQAGGTVSSGDGSTGSVVNTGPGPGGAFCSMGDVTAACTFSKIATVPNGPFASSLEIIFPRNSESAAWAYNKNAYPGMKWQIPMVIRQGTWPYFFSIRQDGGATGLKIVSKLERVLENGVYVYKIPKDYGVLTWDSPVNRSGQNTSVYNVVVSVRDQNGLTIDVPTTLTVGKSEWVFINSSTGSDTIRSDGLSGTFEYPLRSFTPLHNNVQAYDGFRVSGQKARRVVLMGNHLYPLVPNNANGRFRLDPNTPVDSNPGSNPYLPLVYVAQPGYEPIVEAGEVAINNSALAPFIVLGGNNNDFYFAGITYRFHRNYRPRAISSPGENIYMFRIWGTQRRLTWFRNKFQNYQTNLDGSTDNSSMIYFDAEDSYKRYISIVDNEVGGGPILNCDNGTKSCIGTFVSSYLIGNSVYERNYIYHASAESTSPNGHGIIWLKGYAENVTIRANIIDSNTVRYPDDDFRSAGMAGWRGGALNVEFSYNKFKNIHSYYNEADGSIVGVHWYRNSLTGGWTWAGAHFGFNAQAPESFTNNIVGGSYSGFLQSTRIIFTNNIQGVSSSSFDSNMNLTGTAKARYLKTHGAEISD